jgi:hypothetical protein
VQPDPGLTSSICPRHVPERRVPQPEPVERCHPISGDAHSVTVRPHREIHFSVSRPHPPPSPPTLCAGSSQIVYAGALCDGPRWEEWVRNLRRGGNTHVPIRQRWRSQPAHDWPWASGVHSTGLRRVGGRPRSGPLNNLYETDDRDVLRLQSSLTQVPHLLFLLKVELGGCKPATSDGVTIWP